MVFSFNHLFIVLPSSWLLELVRWTKPSFSFKKKIWKRHFRYLRTRRLLEGSLGGVGGTRLSYAIKLLVLSSVACHGLLEMRHGTGSIRNCWLWDTDTQPSANQLHSLYFLIFLWYSSLFPRPEHHRAPDLRVVLCHRYVQPCCRKSLQGSGEGRCQSTNSVKQ